MLGARGIEQERDSTLRRCSVTTLRVALASRSLQEPRLVVVGTHTHVAPFIPQTEEELGHFPLPFRSN